MSLGIYTDLLDAVSRWWNKPNQAQFIPDFVSLAQIRLRRTIRVDWVSRRKTLDATADSVGLLGQEFTLSADYNGIRTIKIIGSPIKSLKYITPEAADNFDLVNQSGLSKFYTIDSNILTILPYPQSTDQIRMVQYFKPELLVATSKETNEYTDNCPDALLFASLLEASMYTKDGEMISLWESRLSSAVEAIVEDDKQRRWGESSMEMSSPYTDIPFTEIATG